jgi:hypothetical protein
VSTDRDVERIVRSWMDEGVNALPDRVLDLVLDQLPATPQRRARWLARRFPPMNSNPFRVGIAATVVVIAAILGFTYLNNQVGTNTPTPTPIPSSTAIPTATHVAIPPLPPWGAPALDPGRYTVVVPGSTVTAALTVGEGWTPGGFYLMNPPDFTKQVSFWTVENVYEDLCDRGSLPDPAIGPTVDDLVAALDAQANTYMSPAVDVEVGGFAGKRVTMAKDLAALPDGGDACSQIASEPLAYFVIPGGGQAPEAEGDMDTFWIIDVDGQRIVISGSQVDPEDTDATTTIAEVIESIEFRIP